MLPIDSLTNSQSPVLLIEDNAHEHYCQWSLSTDICKLIGLLCVSVCGAMCCTHLSCLANYSNGLWLPKLKLQAHGYSQTLHKTCRELSIPMRLHVQEVITDTLCNGWETLCSNQSFNHFTYYFVLDLRPKKVKKHKINFRNNNVMKSSTSLSIIEKINSLRPTIALVKILSDLHMDVHTGLCITSWHYKSILIQCKQLHWP